MAKDLGDQYYFGCEGSIGLPSYLAATASTPVPSPLLLYRGYTDLPTTLSYKLNLTNDFTLFARIRPSICLHIKLCFSGRHLLTFLYFGAYFVDWVTPAQATHLPTAQ